MKRMSVDEYGAGIEKIYNMNCSQEQKDMLQSALDEAFFESNRPKLPSERAMEAKQEELLDLQIQNQKAQNDAMFISGIELINHKLDGWKKWFQ